LSHKPVSQLTHEAGIAHEFASEPQEGFLKVIIGLGGNVVILQILLPVERDGLGLHLALFDIDLVATEHNRDILADPDKIAYEA
jgi:hypothetical protein